MLSTSVLLWLSAASLLLACVCEGMKVELKAASMEEMSTGGPCRDTIQNYDGICRTKGEMKSAKQTLAQDCKYSFPCHATTEVLYCCKKTRAERRSGNRPQKKVDPCDID